MTTSPLRRLALNGFHALKGEAGAAACNAVAMAIIAHTLGASLFGMLALYLAVSELAGRLLFPQCWEAVVRFGEMEEHRPTTRLRSVHKFCVRLDVLGCILGVVIAWACLPLLEHFSSLDGSYRSVGIVVCLLPLSWCMDSALGVFRLLERFELYSRIQWVAGLLKIASVSLAALIYPQPVVLAAAFIFSVLIGAALKGVLARRVLREGGVDIAAPAMPASTAMAEGLLRFVWQQHLNVSLRALAMKLDVLVLGAFAATSTVGAYRAALYVGNIANSMVVPLFAAYFPESRRLLGQGDFRAVRRLTLICCSSALGLGSAALAIFALFGPTMIRIAFGEGFELAYPLTVIYLVGITIALSATPLYSLMLASGAAGAALHSQLIAVTGYALILVPATIMFDAYGTATSHIAYYSLWLVTTLLFLRRSLFGNDPDNAKPT